MSTNTITICTDHREYQVPLIWTFAFKGSELWCPYCGKAGGMFEAGNEVPMTEELKMRLEKYEALSKDFLHAKSVAVASLVKWEGQEIDPDDLPESEKARLSAILKNWKYKVKAEEVVA